jgi:hypothetical protein
MVEENDWRLTNQVNYLMGVSLVHRHYEPATGNDHDHCSFCWAKFMAADHPDILHAGYATTNGSDWICDQCFHDFRARFQWQLIPEGT